MQPGCDAVAPLQLPPHGGTGRVVRPATGAGRSSRGVTFDHWRPFPSRPLIRNSDLASCPRIVDRTIAHIAATLVGPVHARGFAFPFNKDSRDLVIACST